ncbi:MAG: protein-disulfide reductase DsbD domain-containing protein [Rhizobiaceae bacterium]
MKNARSTCLSGFASTAVLLASLALGVAANSALAAESDWFVTEGAKIRLISLPAPDGKTINAGLQINLERGWKTYWRSPGASGLPPQLDFTGSNNIAATAVDYPVPMTFGENENLTAGYDKSVTLPITISPLFAGRPVSVKLSGVVGICAEVCIPVQFALSLQENGQGISSREIASELLLARANLVGPQHSDFMVKAARVNGKTLDIEAVVPVGTSQTTALVEGPASWYLTPARAISIDGTVAQYKVSLMDIPSDAKPEETELRITLVSKGAGVETKLTPARQ